MADLAGLAGLAGSAGLIRGKLTTKYTKQERQAPKRYEERIGKKRRKKAEAEQPVQAVPPKVSKLEDYNE
jgi:hypothetical protein